MKDYLLISNTKENKISNFYLDLVSSHIQKSTNEQVYCRELSSRKAYEWGLSSNKYDSKLKNYNIHVYNINMFCNLKIGYLNG